VADFAIKRNMHMMIMVSEEIWLVMEFTKIMENKTKKDSFNIKCSWENQKGINLNYKLLENKSDQIIN